MRSDIVVQKVFQHTNRFKSLISENPFYEGKCSSWMHGEGVFIQETTNLKFLYLFEKDGTYKSYDLSLEPLSA